MAPALSHMSALQSLRSVNLFPPLAFGSPVFGWTWSCLTSWRSGVVSASLPPAYSTQPAAIDCLPRSLDLVRFHLRRSKALQQYTGSYPVSYQHNCCCDSSPLDAILLCVSKTLSLLEAFCIPALSKGLHTASPAGFPHRCNAQIHGS